MAVIKQLSIFVENKPGRMARVAKILSEAGINIRALTIAEAGDFGVIRMIVNDPLKGYKVLNSAGFTVSETDVLAIEMKDQPGSLYVVVDALGKNNVNIDYAYAFVTEKAKRAMLIMRVGERVGDIDRATKVLKGAKVKLATKEDLEMV
jgi:hypothetical protein